MRDYMHNDPPYPGRGDPAWSGAHRGTAGNALNLEAEKEKGLKMMQNFVELSTDNCQLPLDQLFSSAPWEDEQLIAAREELNRCKSMLDTMERREWERLASAANVADQVKIELRRRYQVEMSTIAWAKMYESISACGLLPDDHVDASRQGVLTVHLCEAPGAFICATNHYIQTRRHWHWDWLAVSLNPFFEGNDQFAMVDDDRLIVATKDHWCFGEDRSGDIRKQSNIRAVWQAAHDKANALHCSGALMVTADGAVDCSMNPNAQETLTASLHFCEVVAALGLLAPGGNFVWKGFTLYEHPSLCSLFLMGCLFDRVAVYKPATSKPANSEVYVIGQGFRGVEQHVLEALLQHVGDDTFSRRAMFPRHVLPDDFYASAARAAVSFGQSTSVAIMDALQLRNIKPGAVKGVMDKAKAWFAEHWCTALNLQPLSRDKFLAPDVLLDGSNNNTSNVIAKRRDLQGTLANRQQEYARRQKVLGSTASALEVGKRPLDEDEDEDAGAAKRQRLGGEDAGSGEGAGMGHISSAAMKMMEKMGHKAGMGLGANQQGITSALDPSANLMRSGLGFGQGHTSAAMQPDWSPAPSTGLLTNDSPLTALETRAWSIDTQERPPKLTKSKWMPDDVVLTGLRAARTEAAEATSQSGGAGLGLGAARRRRLCHHARPCVAPRGSADQDRSYWKLASLNAAVSVCSIAAGSVENVRASDAHFALDLSHRSCGASKCVLEQVEHEWRAVGLGTESGRQLAAQTHSFSVCADVPCALDASSADATAAAAASVAAAAGGGSGGKITLVLGDLSSLSRMRSHSSSSSSSSRQDGCGAGPMEGELSQHYQRRLAWECAVALATLRPGGALVLRLGDCLTMFTASCLYILHRTFEKICLLKTFASCSCSGERFLVCQGRLPDGGTAAELFKSVLLRLSSLPSDSSMVADVVPANLLLTCPMYKYVVMCNQGLAEREMRQLRHVVAHQPEREPEASEYKGIRVEAQARLEGRVVKQEGKEGSAPEGWVRGSAAARAGAGVEPAGSIKAESSQGGDADAHGGAAGAAADRDAQGSAHERVRSPPPLEVDAQAVSELPDGHIRGPPRPPRFRPCAPPPKPHGPYVPKHPPKPHVNPRPQQQHHQHHQPDALHQKDHHGDAQLQHHQHHHAPVVQPQPGTHPQGHAAASQAEPGPSTPHDLDLRTISGKGTEQVCALHCPAWPQQLPRVDPIVVERWEYRRFVKTDDRSVMQLSLLPTGPSDAHALGKLMGYMANNQPGKHEKIGVVRVKAHEGHLALVAREHAEGAQGLVLHIMPPK